MSKYLLSLYVLHVTAKILICCKAIAIAIPFRVMLVVIGLVYEESAKILQFECVI